MTAEVNQGFMYPNCHVMFFSNLFHYICENNSNEIPQKATSNNAKFDLSKVSHEGMNK